MTKDRESRPASVLVYTSKDGINWVFAGIDPDWTYLWAQSESIVAENVSRDARAADTNEVPLSERRFGV
jgi:hypothetical protein